MPQYIISLKDGKSEAELEKAKKDATDKGGKIVNELGLIKGFTVDLPEDHIGILESNEHVNVEADGKVTTQ